LIASTISGLLEAGAPADAAILAVGREPLSRSQLRAHVGATVAALNARGIGRGDRVAIVLPNGPELACAFLATACGACAAPLNPAYRSGDFRFYLADLGAKALLIERGSRSEALAVAKALGIPVLELECGARDPAGLFSLRGDAVGPAKSDGMAGAGDVALVLHTSGTTARPKMVPLSQRNLAASAANIIRTLRLEPGDRGLAVMPLFHIHGLVAGVLAPLGAGGSVFCAPGMDPLRFYAWMAESMPTWYTAVPTMHQAILAHAADNRATVERVRLRFIRSSSAPLPPAVMRRLEETFGAPVIESYGMTEAAHQMASNPLPPAPRKAGSVGVAAGPEVAIMGADGGLLAPGATGEVVIRGANVMAGYGGGAELNAAAFANGWFRTGDLGVLDADGYLTITGRLKEIINRGGEKISPREIDDAIMEHPDVASAATFPMPHPTLGEEIGAAVVARRGAILSERSLAEFLSGRLADFKIPRRFVAVADIPKGPTGKVQRHELAAALGLDGSAAPPDAARRRAPTPLEARLLPLWRKILQSPQEPGLDDNFFLLGGDSLLAVSLLLEVKKELGRSLPLSVMLEAGTIAGMAARIERDSALRCLVPIHTSGRRAPFYCIHGLNGQVLNGQNLARHLGEDQPFYGLQSVGLDGKQAPLSRIEDMAERYLAEMREHQPRGPYYVGGYSMGGWVAYEIARQLLACGERIGLLALIDPYFVDERARATFRQWLRRRWADFARLPVAELPGFLVQRLRNAPGMLAQHLRRKWTVRKDVATGDDVASGDENQRKVVEANHLAVRSYRARVEPLDCDAVLFNANLAAWDDPAMQDGWSTVIRGRLERRRLDVPHAHMLDEPHVAKLAAALSACLLESRSRVQAPA
jgi:acyl-CoA synthetase (AMP-forming)/AMP-acid ligase II/thioesterase domain-containing protein